MAAITVDTLVTELKTIYRSKGVKKAREDLKGFKKQARETAGGLRDLQKGFLELTAVRVIGTVLRELGAGLFNTLRSFESLKVSLVTVTGSAEAGAAAFELIRQSAKALPFSVEEITESFIRLRALGIEPTEEVIESVANTASATQKSFLQVTEAIADATTGEFERLKELGIKVNAQGENLKVIFQGQTHEIEKGAEAIQRFLFETVGLGTFAGAAAGQMTTLNGIISNLIDNLQAFALEVGEAGLQDALKELLTFVRDLVGGGGDLAVVIGRTLAAAVRNVTQSLRRMTSQDIGDFLKSAIKLAGGFLEVMTDLAKIIVIVVEALGGPGNLIGMLVAARSAMLGFQLITASATTTVAGMGPALTGLGKGFIALGIAIAGAQLVIAGFHRDIARLRASGAELGEDAGAGFKDTTGQSLAEHRDRLDRKIINEQRRVDAERAKLSPDRIKSHLLPNGERIPFNEQLGVLAAATFSSPEELVSDAALVELKKQRQIVDAELKKRADAGEAAFDRRAKQREFAANALNRNAEIARLSRRGRRGDLSAKERKQLRKLQLERNDLLRRAGEEPGEVIDVKKKKKGKGAGKTALDSQIEAEISRQVSLAETEAGRAVLTEGGTIDDAVAAAREAGQLAREETLRKIEKGEIKLKGPKGETTAFEAKLNAEIDRQVREAEEDAGAFALAAGRDEEGAIAAARAAGARTRAELRRKLAAGRFGQAPGVAALLRQAGLQDHARHVTPPVITVQITRNEISAPISAPVTVEGPFADGDDAGEKIARRLAEDAGRNLKAAIDENTTREVR